MPHFMIVLIPYINLLNLSWIKKNVYFWRIWNLQSWFPIISGLQLFSAVGPVCQPDEFLCQNKEQCLPRDFVCNFVSDCSDNSDELNCGMHDAQFSPFMSVLTLKV